MDFENQSSGKYLPAIGLSRLELGQKEMLKRGMKAKGY